MPEPRGNAQPASRWRGRAELRGRPGIQRCDVPAAAPLPLAPRALGQGQPDRRRPVNKSVRPAVDAQRAAARLGCLPGVPLPVSPAGTAHPRVCHGSRHLQCRAASGEGAHGLDRSRLAKYRQRRTNPRRRQTPRHGTCPRYASGGDHTRSAPPGLPSPAGAVARPGDRTAPRVRIRALMVTQRRRAFIRPVHDAHHGRHRKPSGRSHLPARQAVPAPGPVPAIGAGVDTGGGHCGHAVSVSCGAQ